MNGDARGGTGVGSATGTRQGSRLTDIDAFVTGDAGGGVASGLDVAGPLTLDGGGGVDGDAVTLAGGRCCVWSGG
jgi:hypothetical protein